MLGTRGFAHVRREFSVLAEGWHIFGWRRVTVKTWQKPETVLEKSLAPRVFITCRSQWQLILLLQLLRVTPGSITFLLGTRNWAKFFHIEIPKCLKHWWLASLLKEEDSAGLHVLFCYRRTTTLENCNLTDLQAKNKWKFWRELQLYMYVLLY